MANSVKPQSMQTLSSGNAKTVGLLRFFSPRKWMTISEGNSCRFSEPQDLHVMSVTSPKVSSGTRPVLPISKSASLPHGLCQAGL
jgi:hypothetical protein